MKLRLKDAGLYEIIGFGIEINEYSGNYWCFVSFKNLETQEITKHFPDTIVSLLNDGNLTIEK